MLLINSKEVREIGEQSSSSIPTTILGKVVQKQLLQALQCINMFEKFKLGFQKLHSTETSTTFPLVLNIFFWVFF